ncbi:MAG: NAD-dependent malic enzyme [Deltaproteobacteria bacterium]|nr:NAD-dependent malic enzyme [Deltaproteobacteria bacterium]
MTTRSALEILHDPQLNKGTAFSLEERDRYGLEGLLPPVVETLEQRVGRAAAQCESCANDLARYVFLSQLQDTDETLFYALLVSDPNKYMPLVYTPTVGEACEEFGHIFRHSKGMFLSHSLKGRLKETLQNWPKKDVRFIVVTDGSRILGLGDLGANGMGIPVGKLALYIAAAGVPPEYTLPITLDLGTDNEDLLKDPFYPGLRQKRVQGDEYFDFLEEFVSAVEEVFPGCCLQFEDFNIHHAGPLLDRYKDRLCCFNDDIQGTAGVGTAGLFAASRLKGEKISDQRILFLGAGSAGCGIAELIVMAMVREGLSEAEARSHVWLFDVDGLVNQARVDSLLDFQKPFAVDRPDCHDFSQAIREMKATAIFGVSTVGGAFNEEVLKTMAEINERPIIFPYSNPTSRSECTAAEAYAATEERCLFASGTPMPPLKVKGKMIEPAQGNNVYIFPALGLAVYATKARRVTEEMFLVAGETLAKQLSDEEMAAGLLYPSRKRIRASSAAIATKIAEKIFDLGLSPLDRPEDIEAFIADCTYEPAYSPLD